MGNKFSRGKNENTIPGGGTGEFHYNLKKEDVEFYKKNGYVILRNFYSEEQLDEWRAAVDEAVKLRTRDWKFPFKGDEDKVNDDFEYYDKIYTQRLNLWTTNQTVKDLFLKYGGEIGRIACELEGVDGMRIWHDQTLIKNAYANPTSWHLDDPFWSFDSKNAISCWMPLDDATPMNGALSFIPGSHKVIGAKKDPFTQINITKNMDEVFKVHPEVTTIDTKAGYYKAGDISFHNGLLVHGATPNMTNGLRRAMTCGMMPDGATFNGKQNIFCKKQMDKYKIGDPLNDDIDNPLLWSKEHQKPRFPEGLPFLPPNGHYYQ